jgi:hypothetical protein
MAISVEAIKILLVLITSYGPTKSWTIRIGFSFQSITRTFSPFPIPGSDAITCPENKCPPRATNGTAASDIITRLIDGSQVVSDIFAQLLLRVLFYIKKYNLIK